MFVFFFKQKTAYEMRISDWSSDVCSSDLPRLPQRGKPRNHKIDPPIRRRCRRPAAFVRDPVFIAQGRRNAKIGRASCRERVLSVRVDLGGRRIIKKKKTHINTTKTPSHTQKNQQWTHSHHKMYSR